MKRWNTQVEKVKATDTPITSDSMTSSFEMKASMIDIKNTSHVKNIPIPIEPTA